ncbi:MAG: hypothetical protein QOI58_1204 [Thermoanaerobaculia bacterium]|nr:hypothetical protein [Thermoanaerobaculia bacterium]
MRWQILQEIGHFERGSIPEIPPGALDHDRREIDAGDVGCAIRGDARGQPEAAAGVEQVAAVWDLAQQPRRMRREAGAWRQRRDCVKVAGDVMRSHASNDSANHHRQLDRNRRRVHDRRDPYGIDNMVLGQTTLDHGRLV